MGITAGFSRNTPHDGYFFDHPDEIIAGAIPPPKFNIRNMEAIARHVRSLVLEHAQLDIPNNLTPYLTEKGSLIEPKIQEILDKVTQAGPCCRRHGLDALVGHRRCNAAVAGQAGGRFSWA